MRHLAATLRLVRPTTLVAPASGVLAGAAAARGATCGDGAWAPVLAGAAAAVLLNAASNALNALADRDADAVNKPDRPLAAGGRRAPAVALAAALGIAGAMLSALAGRQFLVCALAGALASAAYSAPPLRLKRWAWTAGGAIALARGWLLVVAGWATVADVTAEAAPWWLGACFFAFLLGAQATKDFADVAGDRAAGVATWPVALGPARAAARVGAFLTLPWLALPLLGLAGGVAVAPGPLTVGALGCAVLGAAGWALLRHDPARRAGENHPAWLLMYAQLTLGHATVAWGALAAAPPSRALPDRRLVVLGLDGLDPGLVDRFVASGDCPAFAALAAAGGGVHRLAVSDPPISPSVWATFATGLDPAGHRVLDFVRRDAASYALRPGLLDVGPPLRLGGFVLGPPGVRNRRQGVPFWERLWAAGLPAHAYWVPNAFPAHACCGAELLAGLGVPDARGGVSSYTLWDSAPGAAGDTEFGGIVLGLPWRENAAASVLPGPWRAGREGIERALVPVRFVAEGAAVRATVGDASVVLPRDGESPWVAVAFPVAPGVRLRARTQFRLLELGGRVRIWARACSLALADAPVAVAAPAAFAREFERHYGPGSPIDLGKTLGWPEETFAAQEGVLPVPTVVADATRDLARRGAILADRLRRTRWACATAVLTEVDRVCHIGWDDPEAVRGIYRAADAVVAQVRDACPPGAVLLVVSDHGFRSFHTAVNLNAWLRRAGYLVLRPDAAPAARSLHDLTRGVALDAVDWTQTRAYAAGLGGIYVNRRGREARGIVDPGDAPALAAEIAAGLSALRDGDAPVVDRVLAATAAGFPVGDPDAPDLFVGFRDGYRVSWQTVLGGVDEPVLAANRRPWRGDHVSAPAEAVPGTLLGSVPVGAGPHHVRDVAPTALAYFGLAVPAELSGRSWSISAARR